MSDFTKLNRFERVAKLNGASAKARAVWAMAHNAIDRRGRMELGGAEWKSVMCRRLGIETSERQWFHAGLRELEQRGLISVVDDVFTLLGHADSDKHLRPTFPGPPSNLLPTSPVPTSDLPSTCSGPSPPLPPPPPPPVPPPPLPTPPHPSARPPPPTSTGPSPDLPKTSTGPSQDLHPIYTQPTADLPSGTLENHSESAPRARVQNREEESRIDKIAGSRRRSKSDPISDERVDGLIGLYRELHGKDDRWSPEAKEGSHTRAAHILRALEGIGGDRLSEAEVALALRGNALNPWHKEAGKHEISYILRANKVHAFIAEGKRYAAGPGQDDSSPIESAKNEEAEAAKAYERAVDARERGSMADRPRLEAEEEIARQRTVTARRRLRELEGVSR